jgi:iron-sulfur cluster assembly protein
MATTALPSAITLTDAAVAQVRALLAKADKPAVGLRVSIKTKGCSGMSYDIQYASEKGPADLVVTERGVTIFIDPKAQLFIMGSELDWAEDQWQAGFVFRNPNEKGRCGCGESFHV